MVSLVFFYILQLPHTVISNSEKLTHPTAHSRLCGLGYLVKFLIRNLSYSPCSEPSRTVLLLNVMYIVHNVRPPPVSTQFTPLGRPIYNSSMV